MSGVVRAGIALHFQLSIVKPRGAGKIWSVPSMGARWSFGSGVRQVNAMIDRIDATSDFAVDLGYSVS
ncbi:hypothetical protein ACMAY6_14745 [Luminiphilus sp. nBUS_16]|uniref:hypothetical protein n=1 Tax=Luminiphilus sp. nBUS_16 TaxID=3395315 RepID=UPI003EB6C02A